MSGTIELLRIPAVRGKMPLLPHLDKLSFFLHRHLGKRCQPAANKVWMVKRVPCGRMGVSAQQAMINNKDPSAYCCCQLLLPTATLFQAHFANLCVCVFPGFRFLIPAARPAVGTAPWSFTATPCLFPAGNGSAGGSAGSVNAGLPENEGSRLTFWHIDRQLVASTDS